MKIFGKFFSALLMSLVMSLQGCAAYSAKPIQATVVDSVTGKPLKGVNVVVFWELEWVPAEYSEHRIHGAMELQEAVTNDEGKFYIRGWDPRPLPENVPGRAMLSPSQPSIRFFKSDYKTKIVKNEDSFSYLQDPFFKGDAVRSSQWDGKIISLTPILGNPRWTDVALDINNTMLADCNWKKIPIFIASVIKESVRLQSLYPNEHFDLFRDVYTFDQWGGPEKCGAAKDILKPYLK